MKDRFAFVLLVLALVLGNSTGAGAGTTGSLVGRVLDSISRAPVAGARVSVVSPSQAATSTTDSAGGFRFISLAPDTYVLSVQREGFDPFSVAGVTVQADQSQTVPVALVKTLRTIGRVSVRNVTDLIRPGTTSDVYSVNPAGAAAAAALGGPGGLNSAYSAIASVPGTNVQQGQQGWYQTLNIRGGDIDQVGYELDGVPANRVYDNAPQTMLSNIGQQELQVYTGGTPATADATGIAGYVNQVIRTGTYPGFASLDLGLGDPTFYHKASLEVGGASQNRLFSYYAAFAGVNQDYRYADQFNGVSDPQLFYPVYFPEGRFNVYDGTSGPLNFAPGTVYGIAATADRENVVNLHFGIPHHTDSGKDDVQLLYLNSRILAQMFSSINDEGGPANVANAVGNGGTAYYHDGYLYDGAMYAPVDPSKIRPVYFPYSSGGRPFESVAANDGRDYNDNGVVITKLQYQRNFDPKSYLRLFGYTEYSNWFEGGPGNSQFTGYFGGYLNIYDLPSHTYGFNANYSNQLSDKHLLGLTASYTSARVSRRFTYGYPGNTVGYGFTSLVDAQGYCYDASTHAQTSCFTGTRGTFPTTPPGTPASSSYVLPTGTVDVVNPSGAPTTATWLATDAGYVNTPQPGLTGFCGRRDHGSVPPERPSYVHARGAIRKLR